MIGSKSGAVITKANGWSYVAAGVVASVVPDSGQFGTDVVISGSNICGGGTQLDSVTLGGVALELDTAASCTVILGKAGVAGVAVDTTGDIVITSDTGAVVRGVDRWTYLVQSSIASVVPSAGVSGTRVTLSGTNMLGYMMSM